MSTGNTYANDQYKIITPLLTIAGMMRVKDEAEHIGRAVQSINRICDRIYVMDDHSTDGTFEKARQLRPTCINLHMDTFRSPFEGHDEPRDKNYLLGRVLMRAKPDWIVCIDGDEELEPGGDRKLLDALYALPPQIMACALKIEYLWGIPEMVRVDGRYGNFWRASVFRTRGLTHGFRPNPRINNTGTTVLGYPSALHCGNAPPGLACIQLPIRIKHWGYLTAKDREKKLTRWGDAIYPNPSPAPVFQHWQDLEVLTG